MAAKPKTGLIHPIGVVSDTHALAWPGLLEALSGVEMIIHAGDIGGPEVVDQQTSSSGHPNHRG